MKKIMYVLFTFFAFLLIFVSCTLEQPFTAEDKPDIEKEAKETTSISEEPSNNQNLYFSYSDEFPEFWGVIRVVDPLLAEFNNIKISKSENEIVFTGTITGNENIKYCMNPESGIFLKISAVIIGENGEVKWGQKGHPEKGVYVGNIKAGNSLDFNLSNTAEGEINIGDTLLIIGYIENGMGEDNVLDANKGVFAKHDIKITEEVFNG